MAATLNHGAVSVTTSETTIRAANAARASLLVQNLGSVEIYIGKTGVTTANGIKIAAGDSFGNIQFTGGVVGRAISGTCDVRYWEEVV
jgi:hypothetical protein